MAPQGGILHTPPQGSLQRMWHHHFNASATLLRGVTAIAPAIVAGSRFTGAEVPPQDRCGTSESASTGVSPCSPNRSLPSCCTPVSRASFSLGSEMALLEGTELVLDPRGEVYTRRVRTVSGEL